jgi:hypothetical protein
LAVDLHVVPAPGDLAVQADQERGSVETLLLPDAILLGTVVVGIGQERKAEPVLLREARFVERLLRVPERCRASFQPGVLSFG